MTTRRRKVLYGLLGACGAGLLLAGTAYAAVDVPTAKRSAVQEASVLQYADGSELARVGSLDRELVPLSAVSEDAQRAVLAAEHRSYYDDPALSPTGILRAAWANLRGGGVRQGGSTITQQYVKNAYLSDERTFTRKAKEAVVALKVGQTRSKDEVLEDYLNTVYFGRGAYGIQVAAKTWFGKDAKDLDGAEGAVLAALLKSRPASTRRRTPRPRRPAGGTSSTAWSSRAGSPARTGRRRSTRRSSRSRRAGRTTAPARRATSSSWSRPSSPGSGSERARSSREA